MRIGITGHTDLTERAAQLVHEAIVRHLRSLNAARVVGVTCLAAGADQVFARAVLAVGGTYEVILPSPDYATMVPPAARPTFEELLAGACQVVHTGIARAGVKAYVAANHIMLSRIERLVAVWDGADATRPGGTGDVVTLAGHQGLHTTVIWPLGAERT